MDKEKAKKLATQFAPVFAQKISKEWPIADQIATVDFTGKIEKVADNYNKLFTFDKNDIIPAKVYYSICETTTHYFLFYAVYHVFDWWKKDEPEDLYNYIRDKLDEHIHDMEGILLVVTKDYYKSDEKVRDSVVDGLITVAHNNFYLFSEPMIPADIGESKPRENNLKVVKFNETVDGNIWLDKETLRVKVYIESHGHGIHGDHKRWGGGDYIWYYKPEEEKKTPGTIDKTEKDTTDSKTYELEDIFKDNGLWENRYNDKVFRQNKNGRSGFVYRDKKRLYGGAANPPWSMNDHNDTSPIGEIATDPAIFISRYAQGWGGVSNLYLYNPYLNIK